MRILYVNHYRRHKIVARSEPWTRELVRRGHEVTLLCIAPSARAQADRERGLMPVLKKG